jgi:AcrR family transcriptional regulator
MPSRSEAPLRRIPRQQRGQDRVSTLLDAAAAVISESGYETATMSAIAERGGACIGSLYQFFPNKQAITHALRNRQTECYGNLLASAEQNARTLPLEEFVASLIDMTIDFIEAHPAFLPLLDAPASTRSSSALRDDVRQRLARLFRIRDPRLSSTKAAVVAAVTLRVMKAFNHLYADEEAFWRRRFIREFKLVLTCYLDARLGQDPLSKNRAREG